MIKITKGTEPQIIRDNKLAWKTELLAFLSRSPQPSAAEKKTYAMIVAKRYGDPQVKNALRAECSKKCIYCESYVEETSDFHIDHIKPKAKGKFPELTYEYDNLGLSCTKCNRAKGSQYDASKPFINPYRDDPANHFNAVGGMIKHKLGDIRGEETEIKLNLNRADLILARNRRFSEIHKMVAVALDIAEPIMKATYVDQILKEVDIDKPYSFWTRPYVNFMRDNGHI